MSPSLELAEEGGKKPGRCEVMRPGQPLGHGHIMRGQISLRGQCCLARPGHQGGHHSAVHYSLGPSLLMNLTQISLLNSLYIYHWRKSRGLW